MNQAISHAAEVAGGDRFAFGKNWARFLNVLDDERIAVAVKSLQDMLGVSSLVGKSFVDIGCGSGLFSLSARKLGARVVSFDYDPQSVACTAELGRRYFPGDSEWKVEEASVLDTEFLKSLGTFDIVYSWGVLHHTGAMWTALANVAPLVAPGGRLFVSIYNDQGRTSRMWRRVKRLYNRLPKVLRWPYAVLVYLPRELTAIAILTARGNTMDYVSMIRNYSINSLRGMSWWHDMIDWIGGYPFEVAKPEQVFELYANKGFQLVKLKTCAGGLGCNEFVFEKS
jgi:SAM-dependent methyltransferase